MRGSFGILLRFSGTALPEQIEFHSGRYEIVKAYSVRKLTQQEDKVMAIAGVGLFIQQSTHFQFLAGLWKETLAFNLLWTLSRSPKARPGHQVPTWSWASVDGKIHHRLTPSFKVPKQLAIGSNSSSSSFYNSLTQPTDVNDDYETTWEEIKPLIQYEDIQEVLEFNSLGHSATLVISGCLRVLDLSELKFIPDIILSGPVKDLVCMPIISFRNTKVHPIGSPLQLHGVVLRAKSGIASEYERVGYFWTANQGVASKILATLGKPASGIRLV
jgi:hypothetical protein